MIEYNGHQIEEDHWPLIYDLLDTQLLDEIFQERDAIDTCSNLKCNRKLTNRAQDRGKLIEFYKEEIKDKDTLQEKVNEERQNDFF